MQCVDLSSASLAFSRYRIRKDLLSVLHLGYYSKLVRYSPMSETLGIFMIVQYWESICSSDKGNTSVFFKRTQDERPYFKDQMIEYDF